MITIYEIHGTESVLYDEPRLSLDKPDSDFMVSTHIVRFTNDEILRLSSEHFNGQELLRDMLNIHEARKELSQYEEVLRRLYAVNGDSL